MKRWLIDGMRLYYPDESTAKAQHPGKEVSEIEDTEHLPYIELLLNERIGDIVTIQKNPTEIRQWFRINTMFGECEIMLSKDTLDDHYYDFCLYRLHEKGSLQIPVLWQISTPKSAYSELLIGNMRYFTLEIGKKPTRPKELKGIKQIGTVKFINRAACQFFVVGNDVYVKHTDYFSPSYRKPEDLGTPLEYRARKYGISEKKNKFVYADCWGDVVLRQVAWLKIENMMPFVRRINPVQVGSEICRLMCEHHKFSALADPEWQRFWERAAIMLKSEKKEGND